MSDPVDLVREALQVYVNEADVENGGWIVAHYVAVVGLCRPSLTGGYETRPIVVAPQDQADYVTNGLLGEAPEVLMAADCEEDADDETG